MKTSEINKKNRNLAHMDKNNEEIKTLLLALLFMAGMVLFSQLLCVLHGTSLF
jgi:hypothetical protein